MDLKAESREIIGKSVTALRTQGFIPAEFYGHGTENKHLAVKRDDFRKVFRAAGENTVIYLDMAGQKQPAMIYDVQSDSITGDIIHIDFHRVRMDEKIRAKVPIEFTGKSAAVKEKGGVLNKTLSEIEVEALPGDMPHAFEIDLEPLQDLNQSIYVKNIRVPDTVKVLLDPETVVVSVTPPAKEEEIAPTTVSVEDVKVETEEKKATRATEQEPESNENTPKT